MSMVGRTKWRLPPELDSMIIDYLVDDKPTLASCSLVCSRWLPRSRKHLFRAIVVEPSRRRDPPYELKDFLEALTSSVLLDSPLTCHVSAFDAWSLPTCPVLRSLVLCIECNIDVNPPSPSMARLNTERTHWTLGAYTRILQRHCDAFPALTILRLEILPGGQRMAEALIHAAWGGNHEQVQGDTTQDLTEDVLDEWMWESLEDLLCRFPVLKHMELVCTGDLMEGTKAELRNALEKRLLRLWRSVTAQLVTDHITVQPHWW